MPTDAQLSVYVVSGDTAARESGGHQGHQIPQRLEIITFGGPSKEGPKEAKKLKQELSKRVDVLPPARAKDKLF